MTEVAQMPVEGGEALEPKKYANVLEAIYCKTFGEEEGRKLYAELAKKAIITEVNGRARVEKKENDKTAETSAPSGQEQSQSNETPENAGFHLETPENTGFHLETPVDNKTAEAPAEGKVEEAPAEGKVEEAPAEGKTAEAPAEGKVEEAPAEGKVEEALGRESDARAPARSGQARSQNVEALSDAGIAALNKSIGDNAGFHFEVPSASELHTLNEVNGKNASFHLEAAKTGELEKLQNQFNSRVDAKTTGEETPTAATKETSSKSSGEKEPSLFEMLQSALGGDGKGGDGGDELMTEMLKLVMGAMMATDLKDYEKKLKAAEEAFKKLEERKRKELEDKEKESKEKTDKSKSEPEQTRASAAPVTSQTTNVTNQTPSEIAAEKAYNKIIEKKGKKADKDGFVTVADLEKAGVNVKTDLTPTLKALTKDNPDKIKELIPNGLGNRDSKVSPEFAKKAIEMANMRRAMENMSIRSH